MMTKPAEKFKAIESGTYSVPDLAALMRCSERHVRRMDAAGEIPGRLAFRRLVRFSKRIVDSWLAGESK